MAPRFPQVVAAAWKFEGHSWMDDLAAGRYEVYARFDFLGYGESDRFAEMSSEAAVGARLGSWVKAYLATDSESSSPGFAV
jgi:hypothetical protein